MRIPHNLHDLQIIICKSFAYLNICVVEYLQLSPNIWDLDYPLDSRYTSTSREETNHFEKKINNDIRQYYEKLNVQ